MADEEGRVANDALIDLFYRRESQDTEYEIMVLGLVAQEMSRQLDRLGRRGPIEETSSDSCIRPLASMASEWSCGGLLAPPSGMKATHSGAMKASHSTGPGGTKATHTSGPTGTNAVSTGTTTSANGAHSGCDVDDMRCLQAEIEALRHCLESKFEEMKDGLVQVLQQELRALTVRGPPHARRRQAMLIFAASPFAPWMRSRSL
eukprot:SRR837773.25945.p1 GENE.SRR837773.25945~~SRR837773.25945.p1  ORF type:complete len:234 (+),score=30.89 SRR837773.25945:91-702(+)